MTYSVSNLSDGNEYFLWERGIFFFISFMLKYSWKREKLYAILSFLRVFNWPFNVNNSKEARVLQNSEKQRAFEVNMKLIENRDIPINIILNSRSIN